MFLLAEHIFLYLTLGTKQDGEDEDTLREL